MSEDKRGRKTHKMLRSLDELHNWKNGCCLIDCIHLMLQYEWFAEVWDIFIAIQIIILHIPKIKYIKLSKKNFQQLYGCNMCSTTFCLHFYERQPTKRRYTYQNQVVSTFEIFLVQIFWVHQHLLFC